MNFAAGLVTSLGDYIREGALSTLHANAGRTPLLLFMTGGLNGVGSSLCMQDIYRIGSRCVDGTGHCHVEVHSGWVNLPPDSAIFWRGAEKKYLKPGEENV